MASQVITISRACVLLWFTIFFETVIPTTPSAFTAADTSPYATDSTTDNMTDFATTTISNNTTENVTMVTVFPATTISNNTTVNVTMVTVFPATTIPNNTTGNVTMVTVFPATTIPNNTTDNVTMVTVFPATTIPNNTTENMTMATDFPATTISNNTTKNMTMATDLPATTISNNTTENGTMPTDIPPTAIPNRGNNKWVIIIITAVFTGVILLGILAAFVVYRKYRAGLTDDHEQPLMEATYKRGKAGRSDDPTQPLMDSNKRGKGIKGIPYIGLGYKKDDHEQPVKDASYKHDKGRISNYELWTLVMYAGQSEEEYKLKLAIENLLNASGAGLQNSSYGSTEDLYELLCCWKKKCRTRPIKQTEQLYKACLDAEMVKIIRKLRDLRLVVCDVEGVTPLELEHILWQIGTMSKENITRLLRSLGIEGIVNPDSSLKNIVEQALNKLETWKEGFIPFNPVVMLSLRWEDLEFGRDERDFFLVPQNEKQKLPDTTVCKFAYDATIRHCRKLFSVIESCGRGEGVYIDQKPYENEEVLFDTCKMIKDWIEEQECSNYEKRQRLKSAISSDKYPVPSDHDKDLFSVKTINEKASGDKSKRVAVAYDLLMTDIKPFAKALGVNETKLQDYKIQSTNRSHLKMGTIGLVTILVDK